MRIYWFGYALVSTVLLLDVVSLYRYLALLDLFTGIWIIMSFHGV